MFARLYARYAFVFGSTKALPYRLKSSALETLFGEEIAFDKCAKSAKPLLQIRERINEMIEKAIK